MSQSAITQVDGKFRVEYQPKHPVSGEPYGPPQVFESETLEGLIEKTTAAHANASVALYDTKKQVKLERVLNPDQGRPIRQFASRQLTADERVKIANLRKDPNTAMEATKIELEALLGGSLDEVQAQMNEQEAERMAVVAQAAVDRFLENNPDYIECEINKDAMEKYLLKKELPVTVKNLQIAFDALSDEKKLALRTPQSTTVAPVPAIPAPVAAVEPATPPTTAITEPSATAPRTASTSLSSRGSSAPQTPAALAKKELTHRDVANLSADEYAKLLRDPEMVKQLDKLSR
jgi:hypothetical protein